MALCEVRPTLSEWGDMPHTLIQAMPLVRVWRAELGAEAERRAIEGAGRTPSSRLPEASPG